MWTVIPVFGTCPFFKVFTAQEKKSETTSEMKSVHIWYECMSVCTLFYLSPPYLWLLLRLPSGNQCAACELQRWSFTFPKRTKTKECCSWSICWLIEVWPSISLSDQYIAWIVWILSFSWRKEYSPENTSRRVNMDITFFFTSVDGWTVIFILRDWWLNGACAEFYWFTCT